MSIIVTGHPYALPHYFRVFEYVANRNEFVFVLPKVWKSKTEIRLEKKDGFNIYGLNAWSYGKKSFLGGAFKGWLPGMIFLLPYFKIKFESKVLYSCSEPNLLTTLYNGLIAKILGLKLILFTWQNVLPENRMTGWKLKLSNVLVAANLKLADGIICGNKKAEEIVKKFRKNIKTIVCPLSGVDTDKFRPYTAEPPGFRPDIPSDWREKLGVKLEEKLILFCGALDARKGLDVLIKAFDKICKLKTENPEKASGVKPRGGHATLRGPRGFTDCKLIIVGTGPEKEKLIRSVNELGINERVTLFDWMKNEELPSLLNSADVFVYPSVPSGGWEEQFGYAIAEASACGVPVVATKTGSVNEVVVDGVTGLLVTPNNPNELTAAISKILADPNLTKRMGDAGRRFVTQNFSYQIIAQKISDFFIRIR